MELNQLASLRFEFEESETQVQDGFLMCSLYRQLQSAAHVWNRSEPVRAVETEFVTACHESSAAQMTLTLP